MNDLELIVTSDGSHTLRNPRLNETYHSVHGAARESAYVFIDNGLRHFHERVPEVTSVSILEVGFGTGLNAWLALKFSITHHVHIRYVTLEPFPLEEAVWSKLNYAAEDRLNFESIHRAAWETPVAIHPDFTLLKLRCGLAELATTELFHVVFFDAFAPSVQPELWDVAVLHKVVNLMKPGGVFVTYSAKGQVKRDLKGLGLTVETLPGPPGKKEMVRAVF